MRKQNQVCPNDISHYSWGSKCKHIKKQMVEQILLENTIDILCLQEVEVENGFDLDLLSLRGLDLEMENNEVKSRAGIYIAKTLTTHEKLTLKVKIHTW